MLRIGICDDIYDARLVLRAALERVLEKRRVQGQFREFSSGEGLLRWLESHAGELDLVFLDMEMGSWTAWRPPGGSGRRTPDCSWCSSPGMQSTSLTGTPWEPWGIS